MQSFKDRQRKIIEAASPERKQEIKEMLAQNNRDYWEDVAWQSDRAYDGSDEQMWESEEEE